MAKITITELNAALGAYHRTHSKEILMKLRQKSESEQYMSSVPGVKDEYVATALNMSEVLQAFQCDWTPKGTAAMTPIINKVRPVKVELEIDCLEELQRSYAGWLVDEGKDPQDQPITAYIFQELINKIVEEKELNAANAVYAAPTPGTPGAAATAFDGFLTTLQGLITAGAVTPITTGALPANGAGLFDIVEEFVTSIPALYRKRGGVLLMSDLRATQLYIDHRTNFATTYVPGQPFEVKFGNTSITAKGLVSMDGSDRLLYTPKSNFIRMYDVNDAPNVSEVHVQQDKRKLCIWWDTKIGYGFKHVEEIFTNDQA